MTEAGAPDPDQITTKDAFAAALTAVRVRAGLTVRDVAKELGVPFQTLGDYFGGRHLPPRSSNVLGRILSVCGIDDPRAQAAWDAALRRIRRAPGPRARSGVTPYLGLSSFQPEHADWFFGREQLTETLLERLDRSAGLVFVVGPSGSGKSSLLRAGLIPAARAGRLAPGGDWTVVLLTPGEHPTQALDNALAQAPDGPSGRLVIIDQFEELFAACPGDDERRAFLRALDELIASGSPQRPLAVVAGLRADFYAYALRYRQLVPALQHRQVVVGPMSADELRRAIVEPAHRVKAEVEDGLVELLLADIAPARRAGGDAYEAGALPLLSHALLSTWERAGGRGLTVAAYRDSGGIADAVARTAEDLFGSLDEDEQEDARRLFLRLVQVTPDMADTRRRVPLAELSSLDTIVELFVRGRLLSADENHVEITHEALLRAWPRLVGWIDADRAGLRTHRQLTEAATAWQEAEHDEAGLYRGSRLELARDWAGEPDHAARLNPLEREFLEASAAHEQRRLLIERRRRQRLYQLVAALGVLLLVAAGLATVAAIQSAARAQERDLAVSRQIAITANTLRATDVALAAQLSLAAYRIAPTPEARASLIESYAQPTVTRLLTDSGYLQVLALSADGHRLATADAAGAIQLYDTSVTPPTRSAPLVDLHEGTVFGLALRPDGRLLASAGADRTVRLWDLADPAHPQPAGEPLEGAADTIYSLVFSPDGASLAAVSNDATLRLWNVTDPTAPRPAATVALPARLQSVAVRPDGRVLAVGDQAGSVHLFDIADPQHPMLLRTLLTVEPGTTAATIFTLAFTADGASLATGGEDGAVRLWDVTDLTAPTPIGSPLVGATSWVNALAFSGDGATLVAGSSDSYVWVWDVPTGTLRRRLPHPAPVTSVAFFPDGTRIATVAADGTARVWSVTAPAAPGGARIYALAFLPDGLLAAPGNNDTATVWNVTDPRAPVWHRAPFGGSQDPKVDGTGAASPDGRTLALGTRSGEVELWDIVSDPPRLRATLTGPQALVESVAFSPDGRHVVAATDDHNAWLWDIERPHEPGRPLRGHTNYIYYVAFSPDGRTVATASIDNTARLFDVSDPAAPAPLGEPFVTADNYLTSVAFSPDGRLVAVGGADSEIRLFDVTDRDNPRQIGANLPGPHGYIYTLTFSHDSRTLAAGGGTGGVWLYDVSKPARPQRLASLTASTASVNGLAFDPQRPTLLASAGADQTIHLWETDPERVAEQLCAVIGDAVTEEEWARYVPGAERLLPCSAAL